MVTFIRTNAELIAGGAFCLCVVFLLMLVRDVLSWRYNHTNMIVVDENEHGDLTVQCLHCGGQTTVPQGVKIFTYCPGCGRLVERVIDKE